jgi:heptosyltransferase I
MLGQITPPKKICILRLSALGDVCHAVAMVQLIQRYYPTCEITWVIGKIEANLLSGLAGVELVIFDKKAGLQGYKDLRKKLKHRRFDVLLHMQVALRASLASLCIPAKIKVGFDRKRAIEGQWLFTNKKIAPQTQPHVLDGFMGFANYLGIPIESPCWQMPISEQDILWAQSTLNTKQPIAVISPAASKATRNWHSQGYSRIADYLSEKGFKVIICGGPTTSEIELAEEVLSQSQYPHANLVAKTNLKQLMAVLKLAHLVIAPDTGPAHMAVTVGTPVIGLYAHSNPKRTGPYLYQDYVVNYYDEAIKKQYQKPYSELPWGTRAKGDNLMTQITEQQVKDKITTLIATQYPELSINC